MPGPPMTLGNMRELGVQRLIASCLNDACRHVGLIDVSKCPAETEVPSFAMKVVCAKCGSRVVTSTSGPTGKRSRRASLTGKQWR